METGEAVLLIMKMIETSKANLPAPVQAAWSMAAQPKHLGTTGPEDWRAQSR